LLTASGQLVAIIPYIRLLSSTLDGKSSRVFALGALRASREKHSNAVEAFESIVNMLRNGIIHEQDAVIVATFCRGPDLCIAHYAHLQPNSNQTELLNGTNAKVHATTQQPQIATSFHLALVLESR
jgi:glutamine amidotransferase PdxT